MAKVPQINRSDLNKSLIRIAWIVLFIAAIGLVISAVEQKEESLVQGVSTTIEPLEDGNTLIDEEDVLLKIEKIFGNRLTGTPIVEVDIERMERAFKEDPFILDAEVFIDAKESVHIELKQRNPIVRVIDNNGLNYYLDKDGNKMPLSGHFTPRLLTVTGNVPPHTPDFLERESHLLKDIFEMVHFILADQFYRAMIEQIHISNRREFILIPKIGKQIIEFGRSDRIKDKLDNLKIFYKEGLPYAGWQKYESFNLKYKDQVVTKK